MKNLDTSSTEASSEEKSLGRRARQREVHARDLAHYWNGEAPEDRGGFLMKISSVTQQKMSILLQNLELPNTLSEDDLVLHWACAKIHVRGKIEHILDGVH